MRPCIKTSKDAHRHLLVNQLLPTHLHTKKHYPNTYAHAYIRASPGDLAFWFLSLANKIVAKIEFVLTIQYLSVMSFHNIFD